MWACSAKLRGIDFAGEVSAAHVFVDGIVGDVGVGPPSHRAPAQRKKVVVAVVTVDGRTGELVGAPGDRWPSLPRRARPHESVVDSELRSPGW